MGLNVIRVVLCEIWFLSIRGIILIFWIIKISR